MLRVTSAAESSTAVPFSHAHLPNSGSQISDTLTKMWKQLEPTPPHLTYLILSTFLIFYALFSQAIRNRLHLSEPPLAMLTGVLFGPRGINALAPHEWGFLDDLTQEITRVVVGLQVFAVGLELPKRYLPKHWRSIAIFLGPVMAFGWVVCAAFVMMLFGADLPTALVIAACLTPTDPVLAASVLSNSQFSGRVPVRIKHLLSTESGCNDGVSFPFLYVGLAVLTKKTVAGTLKEWGLITIVWQCIAGTVTGAIIGLAANKALRFADSRKLIGHSAFLVFYLLLALLSIGIGSTLGMDDFLVAFAAGAAFANDGWFAGRTRDSKLNNVLDLILSSTFFVYFGAVIPWEQFSPREITPYVTPWRLFLFLVLVVLFRRIPIVLAVKRITPDLKTWREAWFCGHFGPMGVGAIFLAIEARAQLETGTSLPLPNPDPSGKNFHATMLVWPVVTFVVFGSTLVHGFSVAALSVWIHFFRRNKDTRSHTIGGETEPLDGMVHNSEEDDAAGSALEESSGEEEERRGTIRLSND